MKISKRVTIKKSAEDVWAVLGEDFVNISKWVSSVNHSVELKGKPATEAPVCGRVCELGSGTKPATIDEKIISFNRQNRSFALEVTPQAASKMPIIKSISKFGVKQIDDSSCEVACTANITLKPIAYLLLPLLKIGFGKNFGNLLEELQFYLENGTVHPRKVKALAS